MTRYIPPFSLIKQRVSIAAAKGRITVSVEFSELQDIIRLLLRAVQVDEAWYLATNPDVAEAIAKGVITSARAHFIENGYFEGRLPFPIEVDEKWYKASYPDIGEAVDRGEIGSLNEHFREYGYREGRLPSM